jgi:alanyl-tRNA synthetase
MTSTQIRQSFLDFFKSKQHTIVPSSSLMPDSPNLLFTNAGMNQFVPIFLGQTKCPYTPGRAADTQKCIRAGGKHNDLDDVGLDTYHHTFFEMLGNWSFGDYFKKEAIDWAWELVVGIWKFPPSRLYATVYNPDKSKNDPSEFDQNAWNFWAEKFCSVGLDPAVHIIHGNKKDNFWMMGETGPCGPCSELHVDLTPAGDTRGNLVNKGDARCIEIWNLVFIQFNANPDGTFSPLPAKHVDTGMGFERVTGIIQNTKGFTDFTRMISNYETDIFRPIFDTLEKMSGKKYASTLPGDAPVSPSEGPLKTSGEATSNIIEIDAVTDSNPKRDVSSATISANQIALDIAFRVIADHIRTLSFAIADGIQPGNNDRNYVLRRILRRAVRYGRTLGFQEPFFYQLVDVLAETMGDVFPEIRARKKQVQETIQREEEAFNKTLDKGIAIFEQRVKGQSEIEDIYKELHEGSLIRLTREDLKSLPDEYKSALPVLQRVRNRFMRSFVGPQSNPLEGFMSRILIAAGPGVTDQDIPFGPWQTFFIKINDLVENKESGSSKFHEFSIEWEGLLVKVEKQFLALRESIRPGVLPGSFAFKLYDEQGFPLDLTELMARERGLTVDKDGFEKLMDEQRARARAAQKKEVISLSQIETTTPTKFVGFDTLETDAKVVEVVSLKNKTAVILDTSACYAEMGGQVSDTGELSGSGQLWRVVNTQKSGNTFLHFLDTSEPSNARRSEDAAERRALLGSDAADAPIVGTSIKLTVDKSRRDAIQRHHTVTHLLHWALHEVVSKEASQKGSFVGPDKLTFDFNSAPLTPAQVADIEKLVNERIVENAGVSWTEVLYADVKSRKDVMQFFGDKYGDTVRVVQIGGGAGKLDGYSMELCGGTHTRATGEIGLFRIVGENAIAAGVRRIEAIAGLEAYRKASAELALIKTIAGKINSPVHELEHKIAAMLEQQRELEKSLKAAQQREASNAASLLLEEIKTVSGVPAIIHNLGAVNGDFLQMVADSLKGRFKGVIVLGGGPQRGSVALVAAVSPDFTAKVQAGKIIQAIAPIVGGKGGGKPDNARGGGKDASKLDEALAKAKSMLG